MNHQEGKHDLDKIEHLDFAIAEFQDMKMQPALERTFGAQGSVEGVGAD